MSTWGAGIFQNDAASDLLIELVEDGDMQQLHEILNASLAEEEPELEVAAQAVAAADIVAALCGQESAEFKALEEEEEATTDWIRKHANAMDDTLLPKARQAVAAVGNRSELKELWAESEACEEWAEVLQELEVRLMKCEQQVTEARAQKSSRKLPSKTEATVAKKPKKKRITYKIGDIFLVELDEGLKGVGRVLKKDMATVFLEMYRMEPVRSYADWKQVEEPRKAILSIWCYDRWLKDGSWEIVDHMEVGEVEMPLFCILDLSGKFYLKRGGDTYEGEHTGVTITKEECDNYEPYGIADDLAVTKMYTKRLRAAGLMK